tara:strand:- start:2943 stop:3710 length:768 start_codon:yes stop_codon:yes gene_type:complete
MTKETNVTKKEEGVLAANMFEADANSGSQNIKQEDLALPFLKVLGQLSPEINKQNGRYVEGAEPGMIINSVTKELFDGKKGIEVIPCFYKREYLEWKPRELGGGLVGVHSIDDPIVKTTKRDQFNKDVLPNGNYLENTASHFVVVAGKTPTTGLISMTRTQLKVSRTWNSMMMSMKMQGKNGLFTPPTFSHTYHLKSVQMTNDKGTWFGWVITKVGPVSNTDVYSISKDFAEKISKGEVEVKHDVDVVATEKSPY